MRRHPADRVLATVLFTDIVGSTERAAELGDRRWRDLVARHHAIVRAQLKRFRGREIDTAGDGFFATFDRPANAIGCALATVDALRMVGLVIRAGIHAGELEVSGGKVGGIAVHTGARVLAQAGSGEVLVTATIRELVAGSPIEFADRGVTSLKGVPGEWRLYAVVPHQVAGGTAEPGGDDSTPATARARTRARLASVWALVGLAAVLVLTAIAAAVALPRVFAPPVVPGVDTVARVAADGGAFDLAVRVGTRPVGLAAGDGGVWSINSTGGTVSRIDLATGEAAEPTAVGGTPRGIAYGENTAWITTGFRLQAGEPGSVVRFSETLGQVGSIPIGSGANAIAYGEGSVWVADVIGEVVHRIDPANNAIEREVPTGRSPGALAVGGGSVWVMSDLDGIAHRIDARSYEVLARVPVEAPTAVAIAPDARAVWITSELGDTLTRITDNMPIDFAVGDGPRGVAVTEDAVWVALGNPGRLVRVDPLSGEVVATLEVDGLADAVIVDEAGRVWVSVRDR